MIAAAPDAVIPLWPDGPPTRLPDPGPEIEFHTLPGTSGDTVLLRNVSEPALSLFRPEKPNGVGVIVCPGGGWRLLIWEHEGTAIARWLAERGYTAFVLKYRVGATPASPRDFEDAEMQKAAAEGMPTRQTAPRTASELFPESTRPTREAAGDDARRAIAIVRSRAAEWGVAPERIGVLGFSVGACIAVDVAVEPRGAPIAFAAAIYGGDSGRPVPADAPPLFALVAQDDHLVCRITEAYFGEWADAGRAAELHVFRSGGHGFGLTRQGLPTDNWPELFQGWLAGLGFA